MTKFELTCNLITWGGTVANIWMYRRHSRELKLRRSIFLKYRDPEVRALLARLDDIAKGKP